MTSTPLWLAIIIVALLLLGFILLIRHATHEYSKAHRHQHEEEADTWRDWQ